VVACSRWLSKFLKPTHLLHSRPHIAPTTRLSLVVRQPFRCYTTLTASSTADIPVSMFRVSTDSRAERRTGASRVLVPRMAEDPGVTGQR
jgi:hypothetical protein